MTHNPNGSNRECPFCERIQRGEFIQTAVTQVVRFEPLNPITPGHMLFVSDGHYPDATTDPRVTAAVFGRAAEYGKGRGTFNLITSVGLVATQTVPHLHVHFVPRRPGDGLHLPWTGQKPLGATT